jgi:hypothetical protein
MRTQLLGGVALLLGALMWLCGPGVARAQAPTDSSGNAFSSGKAPPPAPRPAQPAVVNAFGQPSATAASQVTPASYGYPGGVMPASGYSPYYSGGVMPASGYSPYYSGSGYSGYGYAGYGYPGYSYAGYGYPGYSYAGYGYSPNYYNYSYPNNTAYLGYYPSSNPQSSPATASAGDGSLPGLPSAPEQLAAEEAPCRKGLCCGLDGPCHRECFWFMAGYDASWIKPAVGTTPLVTTGPPISATSPPGFHPAGLGQPGTMILLGNRADFELFNGVRMSAGLFLDEEDHWALEWDGRLNIANHVRFGFASDNMGNPLFGRPDFDINTGAERAFADAVPGAFSGSIAVDQRSELFGSEINCRYFCCPRGHWRFDALFGFRFLRLAEDLTIRDQATPLPNGVGVLNFEGVPVPFGDVLGDVDSFKAVNHFYGGQVGGGVRFDCCHLFVAAAGKVAVGCTDQEVDINGTTVLFTPGGPLAAGGGIYALPSNIGHHTQPVFGIVPEGDLTFGLKVCSWLNLTASYSFLYWNSVVRPAAQIDRVINPTMVPSDVTFGPGGGPLRPAFHFNTENFWMHTVTLAVDVHY